MNDRMITIGGREVSEDTIAKALNSYFTMEEKTYPLITACDVKDEGRIIINLTNSMTRIIREKAKIRQISIDRRGKVCNDEESYKIDDVYKNRVGIFGTIRE